MSYYRNPQRDTFFPLPRHDDYALLSWVSVADLERVTGAAFRATSAPARMPSAVMVVDVDEMQNGTVANKTAPNSSAHGEVATTIASDDKTALKSQIREAFLLLGEYKHNTNGLWLDMVQERAS